MDELITYLELAKKAALRAGEEILKVYDSANFDIESKKDNSPLTKADRNAHEVIVNDLQESNLPILSEEGAEIPYDDRKSWDYFWMVDPLDGTKEFIKRNGEFTVNIALIHNQTPILGVVYVPVQQKLYFGSQEHGAFLEHMGDSMQLNISPCSLKDSNLRVVASRSHLNESTEEFLAALDNPQIVSMGSSLKFMAIAEGLADVYPRFAPTMEWDTAAAHAIILSCGGSLREQISRAELIYNKQNLLNPNFICYHKKP